MIRLLLAAVMASGAPWALAQSAADAYYDPEEMARAREALRSSHGDQINWLLLGERFEYQSNDGDSLAVWEAQGWIGGDEQKLWFKTEGEYESDGERFEEAEVQLLYSRAVHPFWDLQAGIRHDLNPNPSRTYAVFGAQGLAPYWFELDTQVFISNRGDVSARLEIEYELRLTQRLILQPRVELNAALSDDESIGVGSGLSTTEAGLRLRYEFRREFAPYIGISGNESYGETRDLIRADGEDSGHASLVAGIRFWF